MGENWRVPFDMIYETGAWSVHFVLKGRTTAYVYADNINDNRRLHMPDDFLELNKLLDYSQWPAYCQSLVPENVLTNNERLF